MGNPRFRGPYAFGHSGSRAYDGFIAAYTDGASTVLEPAWEPLLLSDVAGTGVTVDGNTLVATEAEEVRLEFRGAVSNSWGEYVIIGFSARGEPIVEAGRAQVNSLDFVPVLITSQWKSLGVGDTLEVFISSTYEYEQFAWQNCAVLGAIR